MNKIIHNINNSLLLIILNNIIIYSEKIISLFINDFQSIKTFNLIKKKKNVIITQKNVIKKEIYKKKIFNIGYLINILQILKLPDNNLKILIKIKKKIFLYNVYKINNSLFSNYFILKKFLIKNKFKLKIFKKILLHNFKLYYKFNKKIFLKINYKKKKKKKFYKLILIIINYINLDVIQKLKILKILNILKLYKYILYKLISEINIFKIENKIKTLMKFQIFKSQKKIFLNEQLKAIQKELGYTYGSDIQDLEEKILNIKMSKEAKKKIFSELEKLKFTPSISAESSVTRNYIETVISLPWEKRTNIINDISLSQKILNKNHYGLFHIKERILEYLAVQKKTNSIKSTILCFVGAPGVGKTSLAKSIAKAVNRKFVRMSLGGVYDEAEIRGHRRTYIGSMPGKIIKNLIKCEVKNPLFLLDEIDKLGFNYKGDTSGALLEILDKEQNNTFSDHYIEVDFDLSEIMFITTANSLNILPALLDRLEVIKISNYSDIEKINIFKKHLLPRQLKFNGLKKEEILFSKSAIINIIIYYTKEAGVRSLERKISKICRKVVKKILINNKIKKIKIDLNNLKKFLGMPMFLPNIIQKKNRIGYINGLAWTLIGGEVLNIESIITPGNGKMITTGVLGNVMKESIETAKTVIKNKIYFFKKNNNIFQKYDIHIHVPEGSTPKDGPSAGIAMAVVIFSLLTKIPIKYNIAMTGEITLKGEVLRIGGIKEKIMAAYKAKINTIIIPEKNILDLKKIPNYIKKKIKIIPVKWINQVLKISLVHCPYNILN